MLVNNIFLCQIKNINIRILKSVYDIKKNLRHIILIKKSIVRSLTVLLYLTSIIMNMDKKRKKFEKKRPPLFAMKNNSN